MESVFEKSLQGWDGWIEVVGLWESVPEEMLNFKSLKPHSGSVNMDLNVNREEDLETWLEMASRSKEEMSGSGRSHPGFPQRPCQDPSCPLKNLETRIISLVTHAPRRHPVLMEEQTERNKSSVSS